MTKANLEKFDHSSSGYSFGQASGGFGCSNVVYALVVSRGDIVIHSTREVKQGSVLVTKEVIMYWE